MDLSADILWIDISVTGKPTDENNEANLWYRNGKKKRDWWKTVDNDDDTVTRGCTIFMQTLDKDTDSGNTHVILNRLSIAIPKWVYALDTTDDRDDYKTLDVKLPLDSEDLDYLVEQIFKFVYIEAPEPILTTESKNN